MPTQQSLRAWKGNPFTQEFRFKNSDGTGVDLTGKALKFFVSWADGALVKTASEWTLANQADAETRGGATVSLSKAEVLALPTNDVRYEVEIDDETWLYGFLTVRQWAVNND